MSISFLCTFLPISFNFSFPTISLLFSFSACLTFIFTYLSHSNFPSLTVFLSLSFSVSSPSLPVCLIPSLPVYPPLSFLPHPTLIFPLYLLISLSSCCNFSPLIVSLSFSLPLCLTLVFSPVYLPLLLAFSFFSCQSPSLAPCLSRSLPVSLLFSPSLFSIPVSLALPPTLGSSLMRLAAPLSKRRRPSIGCVIDMDFCPKWWKICHGYSQAISPGFSSQEGKRPQQLYNWYGDQFSCFGLYSLSLTGPVNHAACGFCRDGRQIKWWEENEERQRTRRGITFSSDIVADPYICCCVYAPEVWMTRDQFSLAYANQPSCEWHMLATLLACPWCSYLSLFPSLPLYFSLITSPSVSETAEVIQVQFQENQALSWLSASSPLRPEALCNKPDMLHWLPSWLKSWPLHLEPFWLRLL